MWGGSEHSMILMEDGKIDLGETIMAIGYGGSILHQIPQKSNLKVKDVAAIWILPLIKMVPLVSRNKYYGGFGNGSYHSSIPVKVWMEMYHR